MRWLGVLAIVAACGDNLTVTAPDAAAPPPTPMFAQAAYIKSTQPIHDAHFGTSALSGAGNTLVAAQLGTVSAYAHDGTWRVLGELAPGGPVAELGTSVAMSSDGSTIAVGASTGVYLFRSDGATWSYDMRLLGVPASLALTSDGKTLAVASQAPSTGVGRVRIYERGASTWSEVASLAGEADVLAFGPSFALARDGSALAVRVYRAGAIDYTVDVFVRTGDTWQRRATLASPDDRPHQEFGTSISCSARCETIAVGADQPPPPVAVPGMEGAGVAYVFAGDGTAWTPAATLAASNADIGDRFGTAVAVSGDGSTIVAGAPSEASAATGIGGDGANNAALYSGAAYVFHRYRGEWTQALYLKASNAESGDLFGSMVGVADDGSTIIVGAMYESGGSSGVDGDQTDNSQPYCGAIYAFEGTY